jgi:hypothetical protein
MHTFAVVCEWQNAMYAGPNVTGPKKGMRLW